jgi:hypothetical protein
MSSDARRHPRFDVSHASQYGGSLQGSSVKMRLSSLSLGGCAFYGESPFNQQATTLELAPPQEVICDLFEVDPKTEKPVFHRVKGNLIYILPVNQLSGGVYVYGVKFFEEEKQKLEAMITHLKHLASLGRI